MKARPQPSATAAGGQEAGVRTPQRGRRVPGRGVLRPTLTLPESVPMTPDQHDQAVAALATMIYDWLRTCAAAGMAGSVDGPQPEQPGHES